MLRQLRVERFIRERELIAMPGPNCLQCKHRRSIPGDAHSQCAHPSVGDDDMIDMLSRFFTGDYQKAAEELEIRAHKHGIANGWFMWPANFDPVWLTRCTGFESRINNTN